MDSTKQQKCNLCEMLVRNIKVHMKLNHKKKKNKYNGFKRQDNTNVLLDSEKMGKDSSIPNYSRQAVIHKSEQAEKNKKSKPTLNENISEKLSMIGEKVHAEVINSMHAFQQIMQAHIHTNPLDLDDIDDETAQDRIAFETNLALLGLNSIMSNVLKTSINKKVDECPECKGLFQVSGKVAIREFKEHLGVCGLGGVGHCNRFPGQHLFGIKEEKIDLDAVNQLDIKQETTEMDQVNPVYIKEEKVELDEENTLDIGEEKLEPDYVMHPDIGKDSIQGRKEEKFGTKCISKPCDFIIRHCDLEVKVKIKEEPSS